MSFVPPETLGTPSPAAAEAARLARAEQAMKQFCIDLSGLVGRTLESSTLDLENLDLVTAEIYTAAVEAGATGVVRRPPQRPRPRPRSSPGTS